MRLGTYAQSEEEDEEDEEEEMEDSDASGLSLSHLLRRSGRARKPVDHLSPSHPRPRPSLHRSELPFYLQERTPSHR